MSHCETYAQKRGSWSLPFSHLVQLPTLQSLHRTREGEGTSSVDNMFAYRTKNKLGRALNLGSPMRTRTAMSTLLLLCFQADEDFEKPSSSGLKSRKNKTQSHKGFWVQSWKNTRDNQCRRAHRATEVPGESRPLKAVCT